jgi:amino acid adenylation domain-containing protein
MKAYELLVQLRGLNVRISLENGRLRVVEPAPGVLSEQLWLELQHNKEEILRLLEHVTQSRKIRTPITRTERPQNIPLSFAQQRLWFLTQMEGVSEAYHIPLGLRLTGELDRHALKRALDRIVWRHEALRTTFRAGEPPVQQILVPNSGFDLQEHDLSGHENATAELEQLKKEEAVRRFDLEHEPPIRGHLIRMAIQEHMLLIIMHHIASDGWSLGVFVRELSALYRAYHAGEEDPLPPLMVQYADYALWQQQLLSSDVMQRESEYWRRTLEGAPALLELPTDRPRPPHQSFIGDVVELEMDAALTRALKTLAQRNEVTLYMLVVAAWAVVLSRLSGQEVVVIGTVAASRTRPEIEPMIGFFVNTLALRVEVSGNVADLLQRVKSRTLEAQEHQELPFEQVVEIVKPPRSLAHTPIFQVMLAWQAKDEGAPAFAGLNLAFSPVSYAVAKFDLALDLRESGDRIVGGLRYPTALFDRSTIERYGGYLRKALAAMVSDAQQAVTGIDLLSAEERVLLLEAWNSTEAAYPEDLCIHQLFEEQARKTPRATAVVHDRLSLTYLELNQRANRLAHHLIALGVMPDDRVAICMERSLGLVVGLMAILKAGGAYLPLDPAYPSQRLIQILADASPRIALTDSVGREALGPKALKSLMLVDLGESQPSLWAELPAINPHAPTLGLTSHHLAYLIYTSGSTGNPKGVMIEHANAVNLLWWAANLFSAAETRHTLFSTSIQFDLSIYELFMPLACGSTVHLVDDALAMLHPTHPVSLINTVPSAIAALLDEQALPPSIHTINLAGEPLKKTLIQRLFEQSRAARVCNLYGPTETTTYSSWASIQRGEEIFESIGRPIANTRIYLLDNNRQPVPLGAVGELYIGGAGVARGYLNRPDITAERFLKDPFNANPQARMYKTGDLGRYRSDGNIEYLGRNDFQVKIRGFRIELGEIEARLAEHPNVRAAVVLAREDHAGDKRLVAYITAQNASAVDVEALRVHLTALLPEYMVPAAYVVLEKLPLTPNDKLDRKALPSPDAAAYATRGYQPPAGELETTVARVWAQVLKRERVGRNDNFFDLGGHSLLILKMTSLLRQFGIETTVSNLFSHPTVESFAASLAKVSASTAHDSAQQIREGTQTPLFLVHDAGGNGLYFSALAQYLPARLPIYGLPGVPEDEPQLHTMQAMAERMVRLIQAAQPAGPYRLAGWSFGGVLAYEVAQLLLDQGHTVEFLGLIDSWNPDALGIGKHHKRTPESVLRDLCERQRIEMPDGRTASAAFDAPGPDLSFDEMFNYYRRIRALPENFEHLAPHEARVECNNLEYHVEVMAAYRPRQICIPVHLFVASERPPGGPIATAALGWERCVPEYLLYVKTVPGSHRSLMRLPHIKTLGRQLTDSLAAAVTLPHSINVFQAKASD